MKPKRLSKAKPQRSSLNIINTLPQTIIETIPCLLPIKEAARTSILSREWRYKWTKIPELVFCDFTSFRTTKAKHTSGMANARKEIDWRCEYFYALHQILLMRQGPIHEFTLNMNVGGDCFEIDQIIHHLSRSHTVKKLSLDLNDELYSYTLPLSAFSLHQLTDLHLRNIDLEHKLTFSGFGSLRSLYLRYVKISTKALLHLLSNCPSLKNVTLKNLTMHVCEPSEHEMCIPIELLTCLPAIEHFTILGRDYGAEVPVSIPEELPTSLIYLKHFYFKEMCFVDGYGLTFLAVLIKCAPNLEKLKILIDTRDGYCYENEICSGVLEECSDVWLEHLYELEITWFNNLKPELEFVKFILARSPKLKKVIIRLDAPFSKGQELKLLKVLLRPHVHHRLKSLLSEHGKMLRFMMKSRVLVLLLIFLQAFLVTLGVLLAVCFHTKGILQNYGCV